MFISLLSPQALNWDLSPVTVNTWVTIFLQLASSPDIISSKHNFLLPKYSTEALVQIAQVRLMRQIPSMPVHLLESVENCV